MFISEKWKDGKVAEKVWICINLLIYFKFWKIPEKSVFIIFCFISSTDIDWYQEIPDFHSMQNKSEPTWEWEDEQGFSALRHSGETIVTTYFGVGSFFCFLLNLLGQHWLTKLRRFHVHGSTTHHLYPVLCFTTLPPFIAPMSFFTSPPTAITTLLSMSMSFFSFFFFFAQSLHLLHLSP